MEHETACCQGLQMLIDSKFDVRVTMHHDRFPYNKTNQMHQFLKILFSE